MPAAGFAGAMERARFADPIAPPRVTVATFKTYAEARDALDHLGNEGFPVDRAAIVGKGVRFVEEVLGPWRLGWAVWQGLISGAVVGALFGFVFGLFSIVEPLVAGVAVAIYGLIFGAMVGALLALIGYAFVRGRPSFRSVANLQAARFDVRVDTEIAERARGSLGRGRLLSVT